MKGKGLISLVVAGVILFGGFIGYNATHVNIRAGFVGYKYDRTLDQGDERAIKGTSVINQPFYGRVSINPITQEIYKYPTTIVSRSWTSNEEGDEDRDQGFDLGTSEGKNVAADIYLSVKPLDVGKIIANWGGEDFDKIVDNELYGLCKGYASGVTQSYSVYAVQSKRTEIQDEVFKRLSSVLKDSYGIELVRFQLGNVLPPPDIQAKIDQKTDAINKVELARLDRQRQEQENQKIVDKQKSESERDLIKLQKAADAQAYEIQKKADAENLAAKANFQAAELTKKANLQKQMAYTDSYLKNKALDVQLKGYQSINPKLQIMTGNDLKDIYRWFDITGKTTAPAKK